MDFLEILHTALHIIRKHVITNVRLLGFLFAELWPSKVSASSQLSARPRMLIGNNIFVD